MNENGKGILKNERVSNGCQSPSDQAKIISQAPTGTVEQEPHRAIIKGRSRAVLLSPVVLLVSALTPMAVLRVPVVFKRSVLNPVAVLKLAVVLF